MSSMIGRVAILIFCLSGFSTPSSADTFLVRAYGCPGRNPDRSLTGFKTKKFDGILTALHGVLGCKPIKAVPDQGQPLIDELKISGVDIENDIALLTSPELSNKFPDGFDEDAAAVLPNSVLRVQGHPLGISKLTTTFRARTPAIVALRDLLPTGGDFDKLQHRLSPSTSIQVISIDGTILPGHSGAPIFNTQGRIVGVASGGLLGGLAQINWAVPIGNIRLPNPDGNAILDQIARMDAALLFAMGAPVINPGPVSTSERILAAVHANDADSLRRALKVVDIPQHTKNVALSDAAGAGYEDLIPILVTAGAEGDNNVLFETHLLNLRAIQHLMKFMVAKSQFPLSSRNSVIDCSELPDKTERRRTGHCSFIDPRDRCKRTRRTRRYCFTQSGVERLPGGSAGSAQYENDSNERQKSEGADARRCSVLFQSKGCPIRSIRSGSKGRNLFQLLFAGL